MTIDPATLAAAADRLTKYNLNPFNETDNPYGLADIGGADNNLEDALQDVATVGLASSERAAAASETNAAGSAMATAADRVAVAADRTATHTDRLAADAVATATAADRTAVATDRAAVHTDRLAADADAAATAADRLAVAADKAATHTDRLAADADAIATAADRTAVAADKAATHTDRLTADAAAAQALAAAAGLSLPAITAADADKLLIVTAGGTGYVTVAPGSLPAVTSKAGLASTNTLTGRQEFAGGFVEVTSARSNTGTAVALDGTKTVVRHLLTANTTAALPAAPATTNGVYTLTVSLTQDATGNRTVTWAAPSGQSIRWNNSSTAPSLASAATKETVFVFVKMDGETWWRGSLVWKEA